MPGNVFRNPLLSSKLATMTQKTQTTIPPYQPQGQRDRDVARWNGRPYVCLDRECVELVIAGWSKVKFYDFYNLRLEQVMRNLTCDQQIFFTVIWLLLTMTETEEISYERLGWCFSWICFRGCGGGCGRPMKLDILFWGIVVGRFKCGKMGWPLKETFFVKTIFCYLLGFLKRAIKIWFV